MVVDAPPDEHLNRLFNALADGTRRDILHRCARLDELETAWRGRVDRMADLLAQEPPEHGG